IGLMDVFIQMASRKRIGFLSMRASLARLKLTTLFIGFPPRKPLLIGPGLCPGSSFSRVKRAASLLISSGLRNPKRACDCFSPVSPDLASAGAQSYFSFHHR